MKHTRSIFIRRLAATVLAVGLVGGLANALTGCGPGIVTSVGVSAGTGPLWAGGTVTIPPALGPAPAPAPAPLPNPGPLPGDPGINLNPAPAPAPAPAPNPGGPGGGGPGGGPGGGGPGGPP